jgi:hypothetical protein
MQSTKIGPVKAGTMDLNDRQSIALHERSRLGGSLIRRPPDLNLRGYSSVGRAVALQAIGQGFESPYLQFET